MPVTMTGSPTKASTELMLAQMSKLQHGSVCLLFYSLNA